MFKYLNQHSFSILVLLALLGLGNWIRLSGTTSINLMLLALLTTGLAVMFNAMRLRGISFENQDQLIEAITAGGKPALVELYSNY